MPAQVYNQTLKRWEHLTRHQHDGQAWLDAVRGSEDEAIMSMSAFFPDTYLGKGTILQRDISNMPIHPDSDAMAQFMKDWSPFTPAGGWGAQTGFNSSAYGTQPIHMYIVDSTNPSTNYRTFGGNTIIADQNASKWEVDTYMKGQVPLPSWAVPAQNHDRGLAVYDKGTGIMREYFMVQPTADPEVWQGGGGYSIATPGLKNLAQDNYALQQRRGISNVAGMHNSLGFVGITEALDKKINHALCFTFGASWGLKKTYPEILADRQAILDGGGTMPASWPDQKLYGTRVSWPARAADGKAERYIPETTFDRWRNGDYTSPTPHLTPTHGQWGRLKADVDPMFNPETGLPYRPFTRVLIEAAKKYGLVGTDTNLWVNAFNGEQGRTFKHFYGVDPWDKGADGKSGLIQNVYMKGFEGSHTQATDINDFPWDRTEWATLDWGRPSPDWDLRPGQHAPWPAPGLPEPTF